MNNDYHGLCEKCGRRTIVKGATRCGWCNAPLPVDMEELAHAKRQVFQVLSKLSPGDARIVVAHFAKELDIE